MTGRKPGTRNSAAKSGKRPKLNKQTLKDLAPAKGDAVRGGFTAMGITPNIGNAIKTIGAAIP